MLLGNSVDSRLATWVCSRGRSGSSYRQSERKNYSTAGQSATRRCQAGGIQEVSGCNQSHPAQCYESHSVCHEPTRVESVFRAPTTQLKHSTWGRRHSFSFAASDPPFIAQLCVITRRRPVECATDPRALMLSFISQWTAQRCTGETEEVRSQRMREISFSGAVEASMGDKSNRNPLQLIPFR